MKNIYDIMICPNCNNDENITITGTDEIEFDSNNKGHYYCDCFCNDCKHYFRTYMEFEYKIMKSWIR